MTTATPTVLVSSADIEATSTKKYTSPATGSGTWIDKATFMNHSGGTQNFSVWVVPPTTGAADNTNLRISACSLGAAVGDLGPELVGKFLAPGASIYWQASAGSSINGEITGRELTS